MQQKTLIRLNYNRNDIEVLEIHVHCKVDTEVYIEQEKLYFSPFCGHSHLHH